MPTPLSFPIPLDRPLVFFDLETTGLRVGTDRIIELALIRLAPNGDLIERVRRFNPEMPIPAEATAVHGIRDEDVAGEPVFAQVARSLAELLEECDLAGFNIRRFDLPMLLAEFRRSGVPFEISERRLLDVQQIFHREEPRDLGAAVRFYLKRELEDAHSALADIRATAAVLAAQLERYPHLPREIEGLHGYCDAVRPFETEIDQWFRTDGEGGHHFRRGKHRDLPLAEVAAREPDYLRWMLGKGDIDPTVRELVQDALTRAEGSGAP